MSFMNKVKNFFYEDVEDDEEVVVKEKPKKETKIDFKSLLKRHEKFDDEEELDIPEIKEKKNEDLSERELFKAERTFNFPMDLGDEIFDNEEETKVDIPTRREPVREETYTRSIYHNISREEPKKDEPKKKFRPSPVISPVYGILDKNYTVDDVVDVDKTKEFSLDKRMIEYDAVRSRAYIDKNEEIEKSINNDIFYNLDEEDAPNDELQAEEPSVIITYDEIAEAPIEEAKEVEFKETEVKEEIPVEEPEEDEDIAPDVKIETPKKKGKKVKEEKKEESKEDLFNLIDNMYNEDEEEEDE